MRKILLFLILLIPNICYAGVSIGGANCGNVNFGYIPRLLHIGDSITVGSGSTEHAVNGIGGFRTKLQDLMGNKRIFVGQWGHIVGTNASPFPNKETATTDNNYQLIPDYQPRHLGWVGISIAPAGVVLSGLNQLDIWFETSDVRNLVVIMLGTNNAFGEFTCQPEFEPDCTDPSAVRVVDSTDIVGDVTDLIGIVNQVETQDSNTAIIVCLIPPRIFDPAVNETDYLNEWNVLFNSELTSQIETKQLSKNNLYLADMYAPLAPNWTSTYTVDFTHPNDLGYAVIAETLYNLMIAEDLF